MIPIFAQELPPPPSGLMGWLECAVWIAGVAALVSWLIQMWLPKPSIEKQIRRVRAEMQAAFIEKDKYLHEHFATRAELIEKTEAREASAVIFRQEMKDENKALGKKLSERSAEIFTAIRATGEQVAHLEGRLFRENK